MKFAGNEKRIQALFCELTIEDQRDAPGFERVWAYAQARRRERRATFGIWPVAVSAILLAAGLCLLIFWSRSRSSQPANQQVAAVLLRTISTSGASSSQKSDQPVSSDRTKFLNSTHGLHRIVADRKKQRAATIIDKNLALSSWQSPTALLMESPASSVLKSLPELNQSVKALQSFLPGHPGKELNE